MDSIKLGEALNVLRSKKSRLSQLQEKRKDSFWYLSGREPRYLYEELTEDIKNVSDEILALKLRIIKANSKNKLENDMSIQEGILRIGELRSALSNLESLVEQPSIRRGWGYGDDKDVTAEPQLPLKTIDREIQRLSQKKAVLDTMIQKANWQVEV